MNPVLRAGLGYRRTGGLMFGIPEGVDPASLMKVDRLADHPEYQNRDASLTLYAVLGLHQPIAGSTRADRCIANICTGGRGNHSDGRTGFRCLATDGIATTRCAVSR